ncbi:hypothetical protein D3C81_2042040 [compost metagenome]
MVLPLSSASAWIGESAGTTMPLPVPIALPDSGAINRLFLPAFWNAAAFSEPGKSAMAPRSSLSATISLVSGGPEVKFFHCTS